MVLIWHHWRDRQVALGKLAMKMCGLQQDFVTLKNLPRSLSRHASADILEAQWYTLTSNEQPRLNISVHNANVRGNGEIFKELINMNCFLAKQQLSFCANDETSISCNRGNYVELLHTLAAIDERLARYLETSTVFSGFSNIIQNDLIAAIGDVVRYDIKEISAVPFVVAEDESTDVTNKADLCHYVAKSEVACEVKEAFLGFDDVSNDRRAAATYF